MADEQCRGRTRSPGKSQTCRLWVSASASPVKFNQSCGHMMQSRRQEFKRIPAVCELGYPAQQAPAKLWPCKVQQVLLMVQFSFAYSLVTSCPVLPFAACAAAGATAPISLQSAKTSRAWALHLQRRTTAVAPPQLMELEVQAPVAPGDKTARTPAPAPAPVLSWAAPLAAQEAAAATPPLRAVPWAPCARQHPAGAPDRPRLRGPLRRGRRSAAGRPSAWSRPPAR